ncbi:MAG: hypothetical protein R2856_07045 [Caldilineaceae bacterium]
MSKAEALTNSACLPPTPIPKSLLDNEQLDFIDIITDVDTAASSTWPRSAAGGDSPETDGPQPGDVRRDGRHLPPPTYPFRPRELALADADPRPSTRCSNSGRIGTPFRARIHYVNSFPVFANQPFLPSLDQFILTDIGSHILTPPASSSATPLSLYCQTHHVYRDLKSSRRRAKTWPQ